MDNRTIEPASTALDAVDIGLLEALLQGKSVMHHAALSGQPRSKLYIRLHRPAFKDAMREALEARRAEVVCQYADLVWLALESLEQIIRNAHGHYSTPHRLRAIELVLKLKDIHNDNDREETL